MPAERPSALRLSILAFVVLSLFAAMFGRLWFLQVAAPPKLEQTVKARNYRTVQLKPMRGRILDREGRVLADNRRVLTVVVDRKGLNGTAARLDLFTRIAPVLSVTADDLEKRYKSDQYSPLLPLPLADDITESQAVFLLERIEDYRGVDIEENWERVYRYAPFASNILGYLGAITEKTRKVYEAKGYQLNEKVGQTGIEEQFEDVLRGTPGYQRYEINAAGRPIDKLDGVAPTPGKDVQLTIDLGIQQYAERLLDTELKARKRARPPCDTDPGTDICTKGQPPKPNYTAPAGSVVVIDPRNGEVIAMASNPPYDNRWFSQPLPQEKFKQLFGDGSGTDGTNSPLLNRSIQGQYQIGSNMKLFTTLAALRSGVLADPQDRPKVEDAKGLYEIPNCDSGEPSGCTRRNAGSFRYGRPTLPEALTVSSDTYFYSLGAEMWLQRKPAYVLQDELRSFGFGKRTGIQLPNEQGGLLPDAAVKKALSERTPPVISKREGSGYFVGDNINLAIGQGLLGVTPLQLANGFATFANGGTLFKPLIAKAILVSGLPSVAGDPGKIDVSNLDPSQIVTTYAPEVQGQVIIPQEYREPILEGLKGVTQASYVCSLDAPCRQGTAFDTFRGYDWNAFPIYGKTGTAQDKDQLPWKDTSLFTAFGPASPTDVPRFAINALLSEAGFGSQAAAPVVRCLFEHLAKPETIPAITPSSLLDRNQTKAGVLPELSEEDKACLTAGQKLANPTGKND